eukprot:jgi/Ulvmu1/7240/UM035_0027.1
MRERHWDALADSTGVEVTGESSASIKYLLDNDVMDCLPRVVEVSDTASREWSIEKTLGKMFEEWAGLELELGVWKDSGTFILKGAPVDEAQMLLDDHLVKLQAMRSSPFAQPFDEQILPWGRKLSRLQDILDTVLKLQAKWMYLQPIFGSEEIMKQIPKEGAAFKQTDSIWHAAMENIKRSPEIMTIADMPNLLEDLKAACEQLDVVESGLNAFLDTKKLVFPRFFFVSNDELLEVLAEAKSPRSIQPFVRKFIEAADSFKFEESGHISGVISAEREELAFIRNVNPSDMAVEWWLLECESAIKQTLHHLAGQALTAYATTPRVQWILDWAGQLVLNCSQVCWTQEVTEAIVSGGFRGLVEYGDKCTLDLSRIVELVRGSLTKLERASCSALIVIDVHARDVVVAMAEQGVEDVTDFNWESQLRYYWEHDDAPPSGMPPSETLVVKMINASTLYGYEYLGNSGRLVITPLTDRCYRTLIGAIAMNLGGAPAGPAGTGKTETTKDLSKAIAIQCVVFNCSSELDYKAMGKFFKGLACSGAWACFDEFNRIELEVLSVVAQQVLSILRAKQQHLKRFTFEGTELSLRPTCNAFITMNPGYAGRSELPDNLRVLFRDVAMMVPDYAMIGEILLYSFGYLDGRNLAQKLVQTYRLCSEQLSSQDHYDYGMRAVMSVLRAAGNLKQKHAAEREDVLMLRAIQDVNLPKFLDQDVPLFAGILTDLFPGVNLPEIDYSHLTHAIMSNCKKMNLQPIDMFITKIIQLYEMMIVRHGLMLVGFSSIKTCAIRVLAAALTDLNADGLIKEQRVKLWSLNPKSVTMGQLYGQDDPISKEWSDGILAAVFRNAARDTSGDRKWLVLDGPVDAIWIENMNTVLDDNKKLCLNSGEIVAMQGLMNLIFEVQDLCVASPATVSRCGMVYVQPLGWQHLFDSWLNRLPDAVSDEQKSEIATLFAWLLPPLLHAATQIIVRVLPASEMNLSCAAMNLFESLLTEWRQSPKVIEEMPGPQRTLWIQSLFLFSLCWSVGGNTDAAGRGVFNAYLRRLVANDIPEELSLHMQGKRVQINQMMPDTRSVYDFVFDRSHNRWEFWLNKAGDQKSPPSDAEYTNIVIPTVDTIRYTYLLDKYIQQHHAALFVGPTGTGKSIYITKHLQTGLPAVFVNINVKFSAQTSANITQDIIDGKLDKRRKGVYGPPVGHRMVVFVDDLNMPNVEVYGAQPPIELLRQWMDHRGWYDRSTLTFRRLEDIQFVAAMGLPGGGRNHITQRYSRHYNVVSMTAFDVNNMTIIFQALVGWWLEKCNYPASLTKVSKQLVAATIDTYLRCQAHLLPTPAKSHYTFNLRDVSKVCQGLTKATSTVEDQLTMVRLWTHEMLRVFHDRLTDDKDRTWIGNLTCEMLEVHFKEKASRVFSITSTSDQNVLSGMRSLLFADFMVPGADPKLYRHVPDKEKLLQVAQEYLSDYNATSKAPMDLALFSFALEHIVRICRVITLPGGNTLLVGLGGSGRKCLTRLAAAMEEYACFEIAVSKNYGKAEWHDDLRRVIRVAGEACKPVVFCLSDTQIQDESFVEDVSSLLNVYEVPNLFPASDIAQILENIRPKAKLVGMDGNMDLLYAFFLQQVKRHLRIALAFSFVGDAFRDRLRAFPALVNCTTIDWFTAWPEDALQAVAHQYLAGHTGISEDEMRQLPQLCMKFHQTAQDIAVTFLQKEKRHFYVTPTSYLELLLAYRSMLASRQDELSSLRARYLGGLEKLAATAASVEQMRTDLIALQPQLEEAKVTTDMAMEVIAKETVEADKVKEAVSSEEAVASEEAAKVQAIKTECENDLAEAIPVLDKAVKALNTLTKGDIGEVKGMKSPPAGVKLVMETICIMRGIKPGKVKDANGATVLDYWESAKKLLMESDFLEKLRSYDKDNIDPKIISNIQPYLINPEFEPEKVLQASKAAYGLCCWVRAMDSYHRVALVIEPKRNALIEAEQQLGIVMAALKEKQIALQEVMDKLGALAADLKAKRDKKEQLEHDVTMCGIKLDRAQKLMSGLGGEKIRWTTAAEDLQEQHELLVGDVLLAAGHIAYLGAFPSAYRKNACAAWIAAARCHHIKCSAKYSLASILGDAVLIRQWNIWGLPNDDFSTENGIAMELGTRWPLCIDPQGAANKFIRQMCQTRSCVIIQLSDPGYMRSLESAIQFGKPVLLENVGETLDATLEPLLLRQTFKQGGALCIKLGDSVVEFSENFRLYMTTKLRNPHFAPEICVKVSLLNFMTTPEGLEDQLLGIVVAQERPELEESKNRLIIQGAQNKKKLQEIENQILKILSSSEGGNILEDEAAVNVLQSSKAIADDVSEKQVTADATERQIDEARAGYQCIAHYASLMYFCVVDLGFVDYMYSWSISWFSNLFIMSIRESPGSDDLGTRLKALETHFTWLLYQAVCRSLFEKDKLMFAFVMSTKVQLDRKILAVDELRFLLTGGVGLDCTVPNPAPSWISIAKWGEINFLAGLTDPLWSVLPAHMTTHVNKWKQVYDSADPLATGFPSPWDELPPFRKLVLLRTIRMDKVIVAMTQYVGASMGSRFVEPQPFSIEPGYKAANPTTPFIFILSAGSDPMASLLKFADDRGQRVETVSLGQGQGPIAQHWVTQGRKEGFWVVLQNCHLAKSFLPDLEKICETQLVEGAVHTNFRLWITTYSSDIFPVGLLERSIKMTTEAPKGLQAGLQRIYSMDPVADPEFFSGCRKDQEFRKLLFGLSFFHAAVVERRRFGPIGWSIPYAFTEADLGISVRQLRQFLDEYDQVPYDTLSYTAGECNYGGKVTDSHDRRILMVILADFYRPEILQDGYKFSESGTYFAPGFAELSGYLEYIYALPRTAAPEVFGLHENADISKDLQDVGGMLDSLMQTQSSVSSGTGTPVEETIQEIAADIVGRIPGKIDIQHVQRVFPQDYNESMNTVLVQEISRFNALLVVIASSLRNLIMAVQGLALMSNELNAVGNSLLVGRVPDLWLSKSFPSLKPLAAYIKEVMDRLQFFNTWIVYGQPIRFWLPGFFFTQAFLTASKQNYARKFTIPIDAVDFDFFFIEGDHVNEKPEDGHLTYGPFLEGCAWEHGQHRLCESSPKVLYTPMPCIHMLPTRVAEFKIYPHYLCPLYKITSRRGVLSTTGHSTNFVMDIRIPSDMPQSHWIKRGVAMIMSLSE